MNQSDSERIIAILEKAGLTLSSEKEAGILIANVCSVRQRAMDRVYALVDKWHKQKGVKIVLTGCILEKDKKMLRNKVHDIIPINKIGSLANVIRKSEERKLCLLEKSYLEIRPKHQNSFSAYVPIMTGCNNFCAYCVVPYARGCEISRPAGKIIREVQDLVKNGYKEIILLGQNVNSYRFKLKFKNEKLKTTTKNLKSIDFPRLLKIIDAVSGNFWIRFITSHPKDMSDKLINTIAQCKKVCEYIHLPIQSGDDEILKKMNRKYTVKHYLNLVKKIQAKIPNVAISTDVIVGFPGETKKQFENTVRVMKKVKFDMAYIAQYSPRPGTAAAKFKDDIPSQEKKRRYTILNKLLEKIIEEKNKKLVGEELDVLAERCTKSYCFGKTRKFKNVRFNNPPISPYQGGIFVKVKIVKAGAWGLEGTSTLS